LPVSSRERYALAWAIPLGVMALVVLIVLGATAVKDYRALQNARLTLAQLLGEEAKLQAREASLRQELERPQLKEVYRYSRLINEVIARRGFSIQGLMEKVTRLLPEDVRLDALELDLEASGRVVRLAVSAEKEESLEKFLVNLEDSPDFADVSVISHRLPDSKSEDHDLATAACTVRYVGGGEKTQ
jgi:Tfp pilus assembly protein PilN